MSRRRIPSLAVALDTPERTEMTRWCRLFGPRVQALKIGLEAYVRWGPEVAREAAAQGAELFLDLKLHDIPNTMAGAARAARALGATYLTVHAAAGPSALAAAAGAAGDVRLLAVTVLTHLAADDLRRLDLPGSAGERALAWAAMAREAGCAGAVCSPLELPRLRPALPPPFLLVTPGIRFGVGSPADDQRRVATPAAALADGSDLLVIGRPLTRAADPEEALRELRRQTSRRR